MYKYSRRCGVATCMAVALDVRRMHIHSKYVPGGSGGNWNHTTMRVVLHVLAVSGYTSHAKSREGASSAIVRKLARNSTAIAARLENHPRWTTVLPRRDAPAHAWPSYKVYVLYTLTGQARAMIFPTREWCDQPKRRPSTILRGLPINRISACNRM